MQAHSIRCKTCPCAPALSLTRQAQLCPARASQHTQPRAACVVHAGKIATDQLLAVAKQAATYGAEIVMAAVDKPRNITRKEGLDIVTETDKASENACVAAIAKAFPDHAILGEEGGVMGNVNSDYLWCIDPLDGTVNFAHGYQSFNVSVGVLRHASPVAGCVIEFVGGPGNWIARVFTAHRNGGAFCNGKPITVSSVKLLEDALVATELVYDQDLWPFMSGLHEDFAKQSRGVRMVGAAAANLCHLAQGSVDAYWQYNLKPWDVAAGVIVLEEAGGRVTTADGTAYSVFDRSLIATNDALYEKVLSLTEPRTAAMVEDGIKLSQWCVPPGYRVRSGPQLE